MYHQYGCAFAVLAIINIVHFTLTQGVCPSNCRIVTCPNSDCPYGNCKPGWWGRKCEFPLECENRANYETYRGTRNVSSDNKPCLHWIDFPYKNPPDGRNNSLNYCRKADNDNFLWCFLNGGKWGRCSIPNCNNQCPPPDIPEHATVTPPKDGFPINSSLEIICAVFYLPRTQTIKCLPNKQWEPISQCKASCQSPTLNSNSYIINPRTTYLAGDRVNVTCNEGYEIHGSQIIECLNTSSWNHNGPTCTDCQDYLYGYNCSKRCICDSRRTDSCDKIVGTCSCKSGWTGTSCNSDVNECARSSHPCGLNANCTNTDGSYKCKCWNGYRANVQKKCRDINECNEQTPCGANEECRNIPGSYQCLCEPGYRRENSASCARVKCKAFGTLGKHIHIANIQDSYEYEDTVTFVCDPGYETIQQTNTTVLRCERDGNWTTTVPICKVKCPLQCDPRSNCSQSADHACPYNKCKPGWWGRFCENRLQCLLRDASHYYGTKNTTRSGYICDRWDNPPRGTTYIRPPNDPSPENFCRHADNTPGVWCFTLRYGGPRWDYCYVDSCDRQCGPPDIAIYSYVKVLPADGFGNGESISIACDDGYALSGFSTLTCSYIQSKYQWSSDTPNCIGICPKPVLASTSYIVKAKMEYIVGDTMDITCDTGYELNGNETIECLNNKLWNQPFPTCTALCDPPDIKPHSSIVNKTSINRYNDTLEVVCDGGYETSDQTTFSCRDDRTWSGDMPVCLALCDPPDTKAHSSIVNKTSIYRYNDTLEVVCDSGYETSDQTTFFCRDDRTWSGDMPFCLALCDPPVTKRYSRIVDTAEIYRYDDVINVVCDSGYETSDQTTYSCQDDRTWSGDMPVCIAICDTPSTEDHSYIEKKLAKYRYKDVITIKCKEGYQISGHTEFVCQHNRTWSGNFPTCAEFEPPMSSQDNGLYVGAAIGVAVVVTIVLLLVVFVRKR